MTLLARLFEVEKLKRVQFIASRPSTPLFIGGKSTKTISQDSIGLDGSPKGSANGPVIPTPNRAPKGGPGAVSILEAKANGV